MTLGNFVCSDIKEYKKILMLKIFLTKLGFSPIKPFLGRFDHVELFPYTLGISQS